MEKKDEESGWKKEKIEKEKEEEEEAKTEEAETEAAREEKTEEEEEEEEGEGKEGGEKGGEGFGPDTRVTENSRYIGDSDAGRWGLESRRIGDAEPVAGVELLEVGDGLLDPGDVASGSTVADGREKRDARLGRGDVATDSSVAECLESRDAPLGRGDSAPDSFGTDGREWGDCGPHLETLRVRDIGDIEAATSVDALESDVSHG